MKILLRSLIAGVAMAIVLARGPAAIVRLDAQAATSASGSVESLFADAAAKESAVRKVLATSLPNPSLLKAVRTVVSDYEALVRRYPASGYCDDSLWRAAQLSGDAFMAFGDPREQAASARLLASLVSQYPSSKLARSVLRTKPAPVVAADASSSPSSSTTPAPISKPFPGPAPNATAAASPSPSASSSSPSPLATIVAIRRAVLGDVVRVVVELDAEVTFHDERIENPARVFVDLPSTRTIATLKDQTIRFDGDGDVVRQVRLGRHPANTTRIVLEAAGVSSYSVYPLYSPYRLVIDCLRETVEPQGIGELPPLAALPVLQAPQATELVAPGPSLSAAVAAAVGAADNDSEDADPVAGNLVATALPSPAPTLPAPTSSSPRAAATDPTPASSPLRPPSRNITGGFSMARQLGLGVSRIVIDPGHGGHDPGAEGAGTSEAELVLDVSLRLEKLLQRVPGTEVVLTRRADEYVTLQERTAIANREGADLFLSIHANASNSAQVQGVETYFLNFASNLSAAAVAARENAASGQTMGNLPDVVKTIALQNKITESRDFATYVQREMVTRLRPANKTLRDLGVKQAPFVVLIGAAMPSVLAEVSFMTNARDSRLLKSTQYRQRVAEALFNAIQKYQSSLKNVSTVAQRSQQ